MADWSQTWTFFDGEWREGNVPLWGVRTHAIWLGSSVFDGARAFEGVTPDLDLHCARVNPSAQTMFLKPSVSVEQWMELVHEGSKRFAPSTISEKIVPILLVILVFILLGVLLIVALSLIPSG